MRRLIILFLFLSSNICSQNVDKASFQLYIPSNYNQVIFSKRYEVSVYSSDYAQALDLRYVLTEKNLQIIFIGTLTGEKDRLIYTSGLTPDQVSEKITDIDFDSLNENYSNPCITDGSQITVHLNRYNKSKVVHLNNFYQKDIGIIIKSINSLVPKKYAIWYDKKILVKAQNKCLENDPLIFK